MRKADVLKAWFPAKLSIRAIRLGKGRDLRDRIVYGYLAYRDKVGEGATLGEISRATGLNRTTAVIAARDTLRADGLIAEGEGNRICAVEPAEELVGPPTIRDAAHWSDRYPYTTFIPARQDSPLGLNDVWLYWCLWSLAKDSDVVKGLTLAGLGKLAGIHRVTIARCLGRLADLGLIRQYRAKGHRDYFAVKFLPLDPTRLDWFQDAGRTKAPTVLEYEDEEGMSVVDSKFALGNSKNVDILEEEDDDDDDDDEDEDEELEWCEAEGNPVVDAMRDHGFSDTQINTTADLAYSKGMTNTRFTEMIRQAQKDKRPDYHTCYGLLKARIIHLKGQK